VYNTRGYAPRVVRVAPVRFYQPYYSSRPRLSLGFGLWLGYPVRYTSYYGYYDPFYYPYPYDPYGYPYSYPYPSATYPAYPPSAYPPSAYPPATYPPSAYPPSGYPQSAPPATYPQSGYPPPQEPQGSVSAQQTNMGGVSFDIQPSDAQVYVDGQYVGTVGQFTPTSQPIGLTAGRHHIQITAQGYHTMEFDADVVAGEVLPYQGTLER